MAWVLFAQQNTVKTAIRNSRINFYFVTDFYSLYDICIADMRGRVKTLLFLKNHKALTFTSQGFAMSKSCCNFRP